MPHVPSRTAWIGIPLWLILASSGCGKSVSEVEQAARAFVEAYYVRADLKAASDLSAGLAREKIDRQAKLRSAASGRGREPQTPGLSDERSVTYELLEARDRSDGGKIFRFRLSITASSVTLKAQTLVTVGRQGDGAPTRWAVLNFMDIGEGGTIPSGK